MTRSIDASIRSKGSGCSSSPPRQAAWQGQVEEAAPQRDAHASDRYLCPGNERAGGVHNPDYEGSTSSTTTFPRCSRSRVGQGTARFCAANPPLGCAASSASPRHDLSLGELTQAARECVVRVWCEQIEELSERWAWVQVFETRGAMMGCSSPHPHGQVWALDAVPTLVEREAERQRAYLAEHGRPLLLDVLDEELASGERIVLENAHWVVLVPFWARWPFETMLLPRAHRTCLTELPHEERASLAEILGHWTSAMDNLFSCDFPYSFGWHGAPPRADAATRESWLLHAHCYPPLLRSATVRKFMVGFEMLAESQRDLTPEDAAARLRAVVGPHFRQR